MIRVCQPYTVLIATIALVGGVSMSALAQSPVPSSSQDHSLSTPDSAKNHWSPRLSQDQWDKLKNICKNRDCNEVFNAIMDEVEQVPGDNTYKYGALVVLSLYPPTATVSIAAIKTEMVRDVAEAVAHGIINGLALTPEQRQFALLSLAKVKGDNDFAAFVVDISNISGLKDATLIWALLPSTVADLLDANEATAATNPGMGYLGPAYMLAVAEEMKKDCEFAVARRLVSDAKPVLERHIPLFMKGLQENYAGLTNQGVNYELSPALLPRHPHPTQYMESLYDSYAHHYIYFRKRYDEATALLESLPRRLEEIDRAESAYAKERPQAEQELAHMQELLDACEPEQASGMMQRMRERYFAERATTGPAIAKSRGCWRWLAKSYDKIAGEYYEWGSGMAKIKQDIQRAFERGDAALRECWLGDAVQAVREIEGLSAQTGSRCGKKEMETLRTQIEAFRREGLCDKADEARRSQLGARCADLQEKYRKQCAESRDAYGTRNCEPPPGRTGVTYSGCWLDPRGCSNVLIGEAIVCDKGESRLNCGIAVVEGLIRCVTQCNEQLLSRKLNVFTIEGCGRDCHDKAQTDLRACKQPERQPLPVETPRPLHQ